MKSIAVLIPCYNEEITIGPVIQGFRNALPNAAIYVCDNNSSDHTRARAEEAGATVIVEPRQGKGYAIQTLFRHVDADIYVMVDGDGTYPVESVHKLIAPIAEDRADMVIGSRLHEQSRSEFRGVNKLGNRLFLGVLNSLYNSKLTDLLSGYRAFNRRFVKRLPLFGGGFEVETELTMKGLQRGYRIVEIPVDLTPRPPGSHSKIRLVQDGVSILNTILALFRDHKPLTFFGSVGLIFELLGISLLTTLFLDVFPEKLFFLIGIVSVGILLAGMLVILAGLILHTIVRRFQELEYQLENSPQRNEQPY